MLNRIEYCRMKSGLSRIQLAQRVGVTAVIVSEWEDGTAFPSRFRVMRLSRVFGVSADYLLDPRPVEEVQFERGAL